MPRWSFTMKKMLLLVLIFSAGCNYSSNDGSLAVKRRSARPAYDVKSDPKANRAITPEQWKAEVLDSKELVLVDFWGRWCGPCMAMTDTIEELAQEIKVVKVNVDNNLDLARRYDASSIPLLLFFQDGREAMKFTGLTEEHELRQAITHLQTKRANKARAEK